MLIGCFVRVCDEDKIICDFVKHYIKLGFDRIIIYDYNSLISVNDILNKNNLLLNNIIITRKNIYYENDAYHQAIDQNKDLDWLLICDTDEFLYIIILNNFSNFFKEISIFIKYK
jgi:hypothetical protein